MTRVVLDVNVLVSGFPAAHGVPGKLIEAWLQRTFELVLSEHILDGLLVRGPIRTTVLVISRAKLSKPLPS